MYWLEDPWQHFLYLQITWVLHNYTMAATWVTNPMSMAHCKMDILERQKKKKKSENMCSWKNKLNKETRKNFQECPITFANLINSLWGIVPDSFSLLIQFIAFRCVFDQVEWKGKEIYYNFCFLHSSMKLKFTGQNGQWQSPSSLSLQIS